VAIRVPGTGERRRGGTRTFSSVASGPPAMRGRLLAGQTTVTGMEAAGVCREVISVGRVRCRLWGDRRAAGAGRVGGAVPARGAGSAVATSGCAWRQPPAASFGPSGATAHRRFTEWTRTGVRAEPHRPVLDELGFRGGPDRSRHVIDSVNVRAPGPVPLEPVRQPRDPTRCRTEGIRERVRGIRRGIPDECGGYRAAR
jgi:transposase